MKTALLSMMLGFGLVLSGSAAGSYNPKSFAESIQAAIEKAVGAKDSDRILGGYGYRDGNPRANLPSNKSDDAYQAGGIECPEGVTDVKKATELVTANLKATFTNQIISIDSQVSQPSGDTVLVVEIINKSDSTTVSVTVSIFKRPLSRVILLPNYFVKYHGGIG